MREAEVLGSVSPTNKMFAVFITDGSRKSFPVEVPKENINLLEIPTGTKKVLIFSGYNSEELRSVVQIYFCGDEPCEDLENDFFWNPTPHPNARLWNKQKYHSKGKQQIPYSFLTR